MQAKHLILPALGILLVSPLLWADKSNTNPNLDPAPNPPAVWSQSEGVRVQSLPDGRYHA